MFQMCTERPGLNWLFVFPVYCLTTYLNHRSIVNNQAFHKKKCKPLMSIAG